MPIFYTPPYERRIGKLLEVGERKHAEDEIAAGPELWPVVAGTGGCRKARAARGGRGKSGGARIIYFYRSSAGEIYFLAVYAKNEKENISDDDKKALRRFVKALG